VVVKNELLVVYG